MLGTLARWLRFFGYDAAFQGPEVPDEAVLRRATEQGRWLLTRDRELAACGPRTVLVRAEDLEGQIVEVCSRLGLSPRATLTDARCAECNGELREASREEVAALVPPYVQRTAGRFSRCTGCGRMYWPGTHSERILQTMDRVVDVLQRHAPRQE
jgi:uncharacterized protein with PIN domain